MVTVQVSPQVFSSFKGIREFNGLNSGGMISAITCQNVELQPNQIGSEVGIKTVSGNALAYELPTGYKVIEMFKSLQEGITYKFVYAENDEQGILYYVNPTDNELTSLVTGLTVTGTANGITMTSSAYDVFVFTNGEEVRTVCFTSDSGYGDRVKTITAVDYQGRTVKWLSMVAWNGFLVVASQYGVHSSHQNDIYTWNDNPQDVADSWYIDFSKKVNALYSYTQGLYIFTSDDVTFLNTTPNDTANSRMETSAGVGCFSYSSIVKHDLGLFFYDDLQKNIYYIQNVDNGQTRPAGPVAREIQSQFTNVDRFKMYSCIYSNRNEIWCLINNKIFVYDYFQQEWLERTETNLNTVCLIGNNVYTGGENGIIYVENTGSTFNGVYYPSVYQTTYINFSSNTNLKKEKTPLLLVLNDDYTNDFWVELTINGKAKTPKHVKIASKHGGEFADSDSALTILPDKWLFGKAKYSAINPYKKRVIEISTPQTWYTMSVKFYTRTAGQGFCIASMELKNIKEKLKTRGR
jgi:hypothetical protein